MEVGSPKQASKTQENLLDQEPEVDVGAPKLTSKAREKLLVQEPEVDVGAPKLASKAREKLLVQEPDVDVRAPKLASQVQKKLLAQELEPAETTLEVNVEFVELGSRNLVVVPTTAQAGLRIILQEKILRQMT